ncbi:mRNA capping enzyme, large subunit [Westerdykella ornata]|uniref:mRNA cap guanine-N(7) methyltransferase n=1 Tax=Westerdykella ornata TaxID=318751 RepID=A0A6A6JTF5_WESOR|nr:mRNA capping enzyme, large subunit [Westerdykella ornata]KAF2279128.1 mRNA capping enzyme, large subunit [Westerdykella ornata]
MADTGRKRARSESRSQSPPRQRKRPGAAARIPAAEREAARRRQREKEEEAERRAHQEAASRGVHDVVRQHYNMVPERGREWRVTDSKIRGLRSFNNWVKSSTIQKFIGDERNLKILDIGCGKGGDLQKWQSSRKVELYVGADPADVSISQARERYEQMRRRLRRGQYLFHAEFYTKDCFGEWLGDIPIIKEVGIDPSVGPGNAASQRWGGGGFDMVTMMFCMHYAFESEEKARGMLRNVAGALKKGGRFIGCIPNSDVLTAKVIEHHKAKGHGVSGNNAPGEENDRPTFASDDEDDRPTFASDNEEEWDPEKSLDSPKPKESTEEGAEKKPDVENNGEEAKEQGKAEDEGFEWGNSIYRVKFPGKTPKDGIFRPPFGWKYFYFLEEAVEEVPEYVVPWEAFRALAEDYNLELQYRKPFREVWEEQKDDPILGPLSERMGVRDRVTGKLLTTEEELDAADFYHTFCFYKV